MDSATSNTMSAGDWLLLSLLSVFWGSAFLFYKLLSTELPPLTTVVGRIILAGAALAMLLRLRSENLRIPKALWPKFAVLGAMNNVIPFFLIAWGETRISSGTAAILTAAVPIFTLLIASFVHRIERLGALRLVGVACGVLGVAVVIGPAALLGQDLLGQAACIGAAASYGFANSYGRLVTGVAPFRMAYSQFSAAAVMTVPLWLVMDQPWRLPAPSASAWASLIGIAILSTALPYVIYFHLLARVGATNTSQVALLVPVTALLLGASVLGEHFDATSLAGMVLIGFGFVMIDGRLLRRFHGSRM
jgi:drug/metabolite transporter (DMT)-like permease